jgi:hypothetical protein
MTTTVEIVNPHGEVVQSIRDPAHWEFHVNYFEVRFEVYGGQVKTFYTTLPVLVLTEE